MPFLDPIREIAFMIRAAFSWDVVEATLTHEVENNSLTGAYRWRFTGIDGVDGNDGPWIAGAPKRMVDRALVEEGTTLADLAQMLAPGVRKAVHLDFGTPELQGYAVQFPNGKVVTWLNGEPVPPEVGELNPSFSTRR